MNESACTFVLTHDARRNATRQVQGEGKHVTRENALIQKVRGALKHLVLLLCNSAYALRYHVLNFARAAPLAQFEIAARRMRMRVCLSVCSTSLCKKMTIKFFTELSRFLTKEFR